MNQAARSFKLFSKLLNICVTYTLILTQRLTQIKRLCKIYINFTEYSVEYK